MPEARAGIERGLSTVSAAGSKIHRAVTAEAKKPRKENPYYDNGREREGGDKPLSPIRRHLIAASGEFFGTFFFLYFSYAGNVMAADLAPDVLQTPTGQNSSVSIIILALAYTAPLLVNIWAFYRISGGLFNPAVTFGLSLSGTIPWIRGAFLIPAQLLASIIAGALVRCMFSADLSSANTTLGPNTSVVQGLFLEMFFTAQLMFVVLMLAVEKSKDTFLAPIGIGFCVFAILVPGIAYTGAGINPARSFGCAVAGASFPEYHWIYWLGPVLGATIATAYYRFVRWSHYEQVNPGQDAAHPDEHMETLKILEGAIS